MHHAIWPFEIYETPSFLTIIIFFIYLICVYNTAITPQMCIAFLAEKGLDDGDVPDTCCRPDPSYIIESMDELSAEKSRIGYFFFFLHRDDVDPASGYNIIRRIISQVRWYVYIVLSYDNI